MCQSAVSVISAKEGRKSSTVKPLEDGESQMEEITTALEAGLDFSFYIFHWTYNCSFL